MDVRSLARCGVVGALAVFVRCWHRQARISCSWHVLTFDKRGRHQARISSCSHKPSVSSASPRRSHAGTAADGHCGDIKVIVAVVRAYSIDRDVPFTWADDFTVDTGSANSLSRPSVGDAQTTRWLQSSPSHALMKET